MRISDWSSDVCSSDLSDGRSSEMGRQAFISRVNYGYKSKYLVEGTFRIDQSAKFNRESRTGYFPSVSLGWRISEEDFLNTSDLVNELKLRLSYSETGQDDVGRSEEHTSELQSLMRISYAVFCLKKKNKTK